MMKKYDKLTQLFALIVSVLLILVGCSNQTPVPIFITPTIAPTQDIVPTSTAQTVAQVVETDTQPLVVSPTLVPSSPTVEIVQISTVDGNQLPTLVASPTAPPTLINVASATPEAIQSTNAPPPTFETSKSGEFIGAIIGEGYTLPPTSTARPTLAPTLTPTFVVPTQSNEAVTTPMAADNIGLDRTQMGVQLYYHFGVSQWDRTLAQVAELRVDWIKMQVAWDWLQPNNAGQFDQNFRLFQLHVQEADKRGFKVMLSIAKAPDWARNVDRNEDGPPDDPNQLAEFINFLLQQVGPNIDAIEVWNEPNLKREWTGGQALSGAAYMDLFRPAYNAIRAYSPNITIITAGLAPTGNTPNISVNDRDYLQQMYNAGLAQYQDVVVGIHPYSWGNPPDFVCCNNIENQGWDDRPQFFFKNNIEDYRGILQANGHSVPMWVTEFGWATWQDYPSEMPDTWMSYNTPTDQMNYTLRAFEIGQELDYMGPMMLWNLNFANETIVNQRSELAGYSLLYPQFDGSENKRERPLYWALARRP
jgi:polysaccharide biosynthesis protein PslG